MILFNLSALVLLLLLGLCDLLRGGSNMTGTDLIVFTHKTVPVIFESSCIITVAYLFKARTVEA
jgi:hypothetical protein